MLYALLKTVHLLSIVVWIGGMFFTLFCLRPAVAALEGPTRLRLMQDVLGRFFVAVLVAVVLCLASGLWMIGRAADAAAQTGVGFHMPLDWAVMAVLGLLMMAIFGHIRFALYRRLTRAVAAQDWPAGAAALGSIRTSVLVNLCLGVAIILVTKLGAAS